MSDIMTNHVRAYADSRIGQGASNATVNRELALLKRMFKLSINDGTLLAAPHIPMLSENNVRHGFFEREQFNAVCEHLPPPQRAVVTFAYLTGWRIPSEVVTLQWKQVDFDAGVVRLEPGTTKNKQARVFPFDTLRELREVLTAQREATGLVERAKNCIVPYVFHRSASQCADSTAPGRRRAGVLDVPAGSRTISGALPCATCRGRACQTRWR